MLFLTGRNAMTDNVAGATVVSISPTVAPSPKQDVATDNVQSAAATEQPADAGTKGETVGPALNADLPPVMPAATNCPPALKLSDIHTGGADRNNNMITKIYAAQPGEYAVYRADNEVLVHYADDPAKQRAQRRLILPLSTARAEAQWLLQGLPCREVYDRQVAYALQLALDADAEGAKLTLAKIRDEVIAKRAARGRFQYLKSSCGAAAVLICLLFMLTRLHLVGGPELVPLWLAAKAGLVGSAFSIALAIRGRTVALDTDLLANVTDGTLRLAIGVTSAGVLMLLLTSGVLPNLTIGGFSFTAAGLTSQMVLVIGFIGGFLERLVPDLLEKRTGIGSTPNGTPAPSH
jgi:hypothetical protein